MVMGVQDTKVRMCRLTDEQLQTKLDFIRNYINADNAATASVFDSNANVVNKNVGTLMAELNKDIRIQIKRKLVSSYMDKNIAELYIKQLEKHEIYTHDETATVLPYCAAITIYPYIEYGLKLLGGDSKEPRHLSSYNGGIINLIFAVSSQIAGAVALPEYLYYFNLFAKLDYGDNYLEEYTNIIKQELQQVVYAINQPAAARGYQSCFVNVSIFDKYYYETLFSHLVPPGAVTNIKPDWESLNKLQQFFLSWFNEERKKALLTFPVVTVALLHNDEEVLDKEYETFVCKEVVKGNSFFTYLSNTVDSLSSCCFSEDTKVLWKNSYDGVKYTTFKELYETKWDPYKKNLRIFHNGSWINGKPVKLPNRDMYKIVTQNNKVIIVSDNHINATYDGDKTTSQLTVNDYLMFNTIPLQATPDNDLNLSYAQGFVIGAFIGNGSMTPYKNGTVYEIVFSMNINNSQVLLKYLNEANKQVGGENEAYCLKPINNNYSVRITSKQLAAFIIEWTNWNINTKSFNKELNLNVLLQSYDFRAGILDGWYNTDGGNSFRCYTTSKILSEHMEILCTSLGLSTIIDISDRTDEKVIIRNKEYNRNYPLYCVRFYGVLRKRTMKDVYKLKHNSIYFKIKSIEKISYNSDIYCIECKNRDDPYFTLPNGLITHNCRLRSSVSDQINDFQYSLGAGGIQTGSINVISLNMNRFIQDSAKIYEKFNDIAKAIDLIPFILVRLEQQIYLMHKYQLAFRNLFQDLINKHMMPIYDAGFIDIKKQYCTIGLNGLLESAEFLGFKGNYNQDYIEYISKVLSTISKANKDGSKKYNIKFNTEMVPAESLGVKFAKWDKIDGYIVPRECYNSYLFPTEDETISPIAKFYIHGKETLSYCDGGSSLHLALEEYPTTETYRKLLKVAVKSGCPYFCTNVKVTICNDCGYINKHTKNYCVKCGSKNIDYATRVIGYLKRISNFSKDRQKEEAKRYYHTGM